jgi:hypothetical protein
MLQHILSLSLTISKRVLPAFFFFKKVDFIFAACYAPAEPTADSREAATH